MAEAAAAVAPHELIWGITNSVVTARALHLVAGLKLADHVDAEAVSVQELASCCGVDVGALDRVLQLLVTQGIFARHDAGYVHTDASRLLRSDHPMSMSGFARMMALPVMWDAMTHMDHSVSDWRTSSGVDRPRRSLGVPAITPSGRRRVRRGHDGQGAGRHRRHPGRLRLPRLSPPRLTRTAGDFFTDPLPRADAYVLMEVLHDWNDEDVAKILAAVHEAAPAGATLLIIENVLDDEAVDARGHVLEVIMLTFTGGRERTVDQFDVLLAEAGFRHQSLVETNGPMRIVEAVAV
jgi:C-methyltransferase